MNTNFAQFRYRSPTGPLVNGILQRKCACGTRTASGDECETCRARRVQRKLAVGAQSDALELEADRAAERALATPSTAAYDAGPDRVQHATPAASARALDVDPGLSGGAALPSSLRADMEQRFGADFSAVRLHTNQRAAGSARDLNAAAYTAGTDIVFGAGRYAPGTRDGMRLLAHELAHVVQQTTGTAEPSVQRDGMGDVHLAEACDNLVVEIRGKAAYTALPATDKALADEIIGEAGKRPVAERYRFLSKLKLLFDTPVKPAGQISVETKASTQTAAGQEQVRLKQPAAHKDERLEETASHDPARAAFKTTKAGKFGGGSYEVLARSPTDIVVYVKIHLKPAGTGTQADVDAIKAMEDGIEKAASTKGYLVDIEFVNAAGGGAFEVDVDPSKWEVATNWSGGDPKGFAHELHHLLAFELDRYDYTSHADNQSMLIHDRLYWFRQELKKPANYNDPTSIMDDAAHPNDSDVCTVAGLDMKTCMEARQKAAHP